MSITLGPGTDLALGTRTPTAARSRWWAGLSRSQRPGARVILTHYTPSRPPPPPAGQLLVTPLNIELPRRQRTRHPSPFSPSSPSLHSPHSSPTPLSLQDLRLQVPPVAAVQEAFRTVRGGPSHGVAALPAGGRTSARHWSCWSRCSSELPIPGAGVGSLCSELKAAPETCKRLIETPG